MTTTPLPPLSNNQLRQLRLQLKEKTLLLVEGRHALLEACRAGLLPQLLIARLDDGDTAPPEDFNTLMATLADHDLSLSLPAVGCPEETLGKLVNTSSPPTLCGLLPRDLILQHQPWLVATQEHHLIDTLIPPSPDAPPPMILALYGVQDPGNLGTLIRSAVAFGVRALWLLGPCVSPLNPKVIRATTGMLFHLPVMTGGVLQTLPPQHLITLTTQHAPGLTWLGACGTAAHPDTQTPPTPYAHYPWHTTPHVLLLGAEGTGIPADWQPHLHHWLTIPMAPGVDSLNVAIAGSILMAQAFQA